MPVDRKTTYLLASLVAAALTAPGGVRAQVDEDFRAARDAYRDGEHAEVVRLLEPMVGAAIPSVSDRVIAREARKYLGAAYVLGGRRDEGAQQFRWLLEDNRDQLRTMELDRRIFVQEVRDVFEAVQAELVAAEDAATADQAAAREREREARRQALIRLLHEAQEDVVEVENPELPMFVPFGVGQFLNGDEGLGVFFLVSEAFFFVVSSASLSVSLYVDDALRETEEARIIDTYNSLLEGLAVTNLVSAALFTILAVAGIVEARLSWQPTRTVRRSREIDQEILDRLELSVTPGGVGVRF